MKTEDKRIKEARKIFILAWVYFGVYLAVMMSLTYTLGIKPYIWGLPGWVAIANLVVPLFFVIMLIIVVELLIPDISLTDEEDGSKEES
ncbi:MAG: DUF997 family protein [Candidatus Aminicenantes bacterium]|nr:MAG: DUF997 family protein [Candidatus Aminicenantes bacterium]